MDNLKLGEKRSISDIINDETKTRERILLNTTLMFAKEGYSSVSIHDIARESGIKTASIYNHFESKAQLRDEILENSETLYRLYFSRLDQEIVSANCFKDVVNLMFVELLDVSSIFNFYSFSFIITEQIHNEKAATIFNDVFLRYSINFIKSKFDECILKGWAKAFDTEITATFFMHSVLINNCLRIHEHNNVPIAYNIVSMFNSLQDFILNMGNLDN